MDAGKDPVRNTEDDRGSSGGGGGGAPQPSNDHGAGAGAEDTSRAFLAIVYDQLRKLARDRIRDEPAGMTLQATALVHEAWVRLQKNPAARWDNPGHFYKAAAKAMRRILVERARRKMSLKGGGGRARVELAPDQQVRDAPKKGAFDEYDLLALHEALARLESSRGDLAEVVRLRYFAGLTIEETAEVLGVSDTTVSNHWNFARAWLAREIEGRSGR